MENKKFANIEEITEFIKKSPIEDVTSYLEESGFEFIEEEDNDKNAK